MFYVAITAYLIINGTGPHYTDPEGTSLVDILLTFLLLHGLSPGAINSAAPGVWSIGNEVLFYCLLPIILSIVRDFRVASVATIFSFLLALSAPWLVRSALDRAYSTWVIENFSHFNLLMYLPSFFCGILIFYALRLERIRILLKPNTGYLLMVVATVTLIAIGFSAAPRLQHVLFANLPIAAFVLGAAATESKIIANPVLQYIGKVSFSVYLWHFAVVQAVTAMLGTPGLFISYLLVLGVSTSLASLTYFAIEVPAMQFARSMQSRV